ncbi:hypothetical protein vBBceHLY2_00131 [Bacillus phage vB_BceH_LY2]|nr:hypothetical protein vBBceHLY2_00131 [Bacillus phage vB_BceH_LY2]
MNVYIITCNYKGVFKMLKYKTLEQEQQIVD